ncbi:hypothetical protein SM007_36520 [Streptomyces avermitilis]|uniref:Transposase IS4-like domain-containing protein n=1 Tax=Streptomyces avermitilis TaxID=33903 RepID=A0A4D4M9L6_STRAX|nr:hypothetical protein SM007_36520 [Streptomyces avermitilis]GDY68548.1 hypothetical protein SAV14893_079410 [Streptomyces avermitilis]GDY71075.1 hypothetical protein SAV31267_005600 [Streptomyces avermitilis]
MCDGPGSARLALSPRRRFRKDAVLLVDGTLVPTRDHTVVEQSKNYRHSTNHQVVVGSFGSSCRRRRHPAGGRARPATAGQPRRCRASSESGAKNAVGKTVTTADGGYRGTGLVIHLNLAGQANRPPRGR